MLKDKIDVKKLVYLSLLTAIVFVLQYISLFMRFGTFSLTFVLTPIVVGVATCGMWAGAWLGFVFAIAVFVTGDAALFLQFNIPATIVVVIVKGVLAGVAAGVVYKLLEKVNRIVAIFTAAVVTPIVNTGIFFIGCELFFFEDIAEFFAVEAEKVTVFIITGLIGINFIIELVVNLILAPAVCRILDILAKTAPRKRAFARNHSGIASEPVAAVSADEDTVADPADKEACDAGENQA